MSDLDFIRDLVSQHDPPALVDPASARTDSSSESSESSESEDSDADDADADVEVQSCLQTLLSTVAGDALAGDARAIWRRAAARAELGGAAAAAPPLLAHARAQHAVAVRRARALARARTQLARRQEVAPAGAGARAVRGVALALADYSPRDPRQSSHRYLGGVRKARRQACARGAYDCGPVLCPGLSTGPQACTTRALAMEIRTTGWSLGVR